ncbi:MAG: N-formylglutamate amidohydrolase, partial [Pseudomonadota bacterium]
QAFLQASRLDAAALRKSEDCFVDELFAAAPAHGATLIEAHFPRAYLDLNREAYELDPELFDEPLPDYANARTMRVIGGLGTIARIVADAEEIYDQPLSLSVAFERIERLYKPFHRAVVDILDGMIAEFGYAVLIDCHSMPSGDGSSGPTARPDFVVGDRFGSSCSPRVTRLLRQHLGRHGARVQLNRPYAGGYITEHYGQPYANQHAIQIEINRGLYLDERTLQKTASFAVLQRRLSELIAHICAAVPELFEIRRAAE